MEVYKGYYDGISEEIEKMTLEEIDKEIEKIEKELEKKNNQ